MPAISTKRRQIYSETEEEVMAWAEMMHEAGIFYKNPNGTHSFAYYLAEYIKHLKK